MGLILCNKHGKQGIAINIQQEVCEKMLKGDPLHDDNLAVIKVLYFDCDELFLDMNYLVTNVLKEQLKLHDVYEVREDADEEPLSRLFSTKMGIICGQCLNEYKYKKDIQSTLAAYRSNWVR